jgi:hypothetical protein
MAKPTHRPGTLRSAKIAGAIALGATVFATTSCSSSEQELLPGSSSAGAAGAVPDATAAVPDANDEPDVGAGGAGGAGGSGGAGGADAQADGNASAETGSPDAEAPIDAADATVLADAAPDAGPGVGPDAGPDVKPDVGAITDASVRPDVVYVFPDDLADAALDPDGMPAQDAQVAWKHWNYTMNQDHTIQDYRSQPRSIVDQTLDAVVLENDWVKVTLMPDFGGRIASILYKPTGHEELYQNPVGSPWGYREGSFYYNWLMVYGGIFPTLPEPEHGKTWILPWSHKVVERTADKVSVRMSITDDLDTPSGTPNKFAYGKTGITCNATVTLRRDRSSVDFSIDLMNPAPNDVRYEYWTCATLTPGSVPGKTAATAGGEMIAPISQVEVGMGNFGNTGRTMAWGPSVSFFKNWPDMGILYASPSMTGNFWGVVNHDNKEGIFRIADNSITPGLKLWTWGYAQSINVDPSAPTSAAVGARPYFEMWGGVSHKFFDTATLSAGGRKRWTETYLVTNGLDAVSAASPHGAAYLQTATVGTDLVLTADLFTAHPGMDVAGTLSIDAAPVATTTLKADAVTPSRFQSTKALSTISAGAHTLGFLAKDPVGNTLLEGSIAFTR